MMAASYCLLIILNPRRPLTCAVVSASFFFCPLLPWWFAPSHYFPSALCFLSIAVSCQSPQQSIPFATPAVGYGSSGRRSPVIRPSARR